MKGEPHEAFGCKIMNNIKYPDLGIAGDEIGRNSNQKGNGCISGTLHACEKIILFNQECPTKKNVLH